MNRFEGKIAVVTGGNSGIGLASAKRFAQEGARVAITGRDKKTLELAEKEIGAGTLALQADVAKPADLDRLYEAVAQKLGRIDVLFVNAGIAKFAPFTAMPANDYDEQFGINIRGAYFTIQKALPLLNDGGSIVLNTSAAGNKGQAGASAYAASKAALRSLARNLTVELAPRGIRVNAIAPGPIVTPIWGRSQRPKEEVDQFTQQILAAVPLKRFGQAEEVAAAVAFLASSEASYIAGVELHVDGGVGQV
jgi:NAD(P)-dependent dehydrogenase (short-subunit alcohol dehydrogenase family)